MKSKLRLFAIGLSVSLAGCAGQVQLGGSDRIQVIDADALPLPADVDPASRQRIFRVGAFDELLVDVFGFEELRDRKIVTDGSGRFALPMAGTIEANGLTLSEIQAVVTQRLRQAHVRNPQVSVNISEVRSQHVTVDGQVQQPGNYPVLGRTTLMEAVASARGLTDFARKQDVVVFRTVGDQRMVALFNLEAIRRGAYPDPEIFADDVVVVGDSQGRRLFQAFLQASPLLISPLVAILQNN